MSTFGVFAVDRGIFDHSFFAPEPYTEREAWLWMISAAAWKTTRIRSGRKMVWLVRGQLMFSERFLAEKWQWSKSSVRRFVERLKTEAMVTTLGEADGTLIIICNYDKYAFGGQSAGPPAEAKSEPLADHSRTKEEEGLKNLRIKESERESADAPLRRKHQKLKPLIQIPDDFHLTTGRVKIAADMNLDAEVTFSAFRKWAVLSGKRVTDWDLRWLTWCEDQIKRAAKDAAIGAHRITHYGDDGLPRYLGDRDG